MYIYFILASPDITDLLVLPESIAPISLEHPTHSNVFTSKGHLHGFYITLTYFQRRSRVRHGRYPGPEKPLIFSTEVNNGGASNAEVDELWRREHAEKQARRVKRFGRKKRATRPAH